MPGFDLDLRWARDVVSLNAVNAAILLGCLALLVARGKHPRRKWSSALAVVAIWGGGRLLGIGALMALATVLILLGGAEGQRTTQVLAAGWIVVWVGSCFWVAIDTYRRIGRPPRGLDS